MIKTEKSSKFWNKVIEGYESSGLSKAEYCKNQKLPANKFYYWCIKLRPDLKSSPLGNQSSKSEFIPFKATKVESPFTIIFNSGPELKFNSLPDPVWIANLISFAANVDAEY